MRWNRTLCSLPHPHPVLACILSVKYLSKDSLIREMRKYLAGKAKKEIIRKNSRKNSVVIDKEQVPVVPSRTTDAVLGHILQAVYYPMDSSHDPCHGVSEARILEWVVSSMESSLPGDQKPSSPTLDVGSFPTEPPEALYVRCLYTSLLSVKYWS